MNSKTKRNKPTGRNKQIRQEDPANIVPAEISSQSPAFSLEFCDRRTRAAERGCFHAATTMQMRHFTFQHVAK